MELPKPYTSFEKWMDEEVDKRLSEGIYSSWQLLERGRIFVERDILYPKLEFYRYQGRVPRRVRNFLKVRNAITYRGINFLLV